MDPADPRHMQCFIKFEITAQQTNKQPTSASFNNKQQRQTEPEIETSRTNFWVKSDRFKGGERGAKRNKGTFH